MPRFASLRSAQQQQQQQQQHQHQHQHITPGTGNLAINQLNNSTAAIAAAAAAADIERRRREWEEWRHKEEVAWHQRLRAKEEASLRGERAEREGGGCDTENVTESVIEESEATNPLLIHSCSRASFENAPRTFFARRSGGEFRQVQGA